MMMKLAPQSPSQDDFSGRSVWNRLREAAVEAGEGAMRELPSTLRRLRTLALVLSITVPVFLVGLLVVLWHIGH